MKASQAIAKKDLPKSPHGFESIQEQRPISLIKPRLWRCRQIKVADALFTAGPVLSLCAIVEAQIEHLASRAKASTLASSC